MSMGFIQIRRGLLEHAERGSIGFLDLGVYLQIHLQANYETGIWTGSAAKLAATAPRDADCRSIRRSLETLERIGFIKRFMVRGKRGNYPVVINKYEPQSGAMKGRRLNAGQTTDWRRPEYEPCREVSVSPPRDVREDASILKEERKEEEKRSKSIPSAKPAEAAPSKEFEAFWEAYPKKLDKQSAKRAWVKNFCEGHLAEILVSLEAWKAASQWADLKFIPYASTWINKGRHKEIPAREVSSNGNAAAIKPVAGKYDALSIVRASG